MKKDFYSWTSHFMLQNIMGEHLNSKTIYTCDLMPPAGNNEIFDGEFVLMNTAAQKRMTEEGCCLKIRPSQHQQKVDVMYLDFSKIRFMYPLNDSGIKDFFTLSEEQTVSQMHTVVKFFTYPSLELGDRLQDIRISQGDGSRSTAQVSLIGRNSLQTKAGKANMLHKENLLGAYREDPQERHRNNWLETYLTWIKKPATLTKLVDLLRELLIKEFQKDPEKRKGNITPKYQKIITEMFPYAQAPADFITLESIILKLEHIRRWLPLLRIQFDIAGNATTRGGYSLEVFPFLNEAFVYTDDIVNKEQEAFNKLQSTIKTIFSGSSSPDDRYFGDSKPNPEITYTSEDAIEVPANSSLQRKKVKHLTDGASALSYWGHPYAKYIKMILGFYGRRYKGQSMSLYKKFKNYPVLKKDKKGFRMISSPDTMIKDTHKILNIAFNTLVAEPIRNVAKASRRHILSYTPGVNYVEELNKLKLSVDKSGSKVLAIDFKDYFTNINPDLLTRTLEIYGHSNCTASSLDSYSPPSEFYLSDSAYYAHTPHLLLNRLAEEVAQACPKSVWSDKDYFKKIVSENMLRLNSFNTRDILACLTNSTSWIHSMSNAQKDLIRKVVFSIEKSRISYAKTGHAAVPLLHCPGFLSNPNYGYHAYPRDLVLLSIVDLFLKPYITRQNYSITRTYFASMLRNREYGSYVTEGLVTRLTVSDPRALTVDPQSLNSRELKYRDKDLEKAARKRKDAISLKLDEDGQPVDLADKERINRKKALLRTGGAWSKIGIPQGAAYSGTIANLVSAYIYNSTLQDLFGKLKTNKRVKMDVKDVIIYSDNMYVFFDAEKGTDKYILTALESAFKKDWRMERIFSKNKAFILDRNHQDLKLLGLIMDKEGNVRLSRKNLRKVNQEIIHNYHKGKAWTDSLKGKVNWHRSLQKVNEGDYSRELIFQKRASHY